MSDSLYRNPISPLQVYGSSTLDRTKTFGTTFSVLNTGGFMEVYSLSDLNYTIPTGQTGTIEITGNTIPVQFKKGNGSIFSPDVLTLNSDNISSGRRRLGMLVYVYETNKIYQHTIDNYGDLWAAATAASGPGGATVVISDFGTTVKNNSPEGQVLINVWTASTIEGISGYTDMDATWRELKTGGSGTGTGISGFSYSSNTLTILDATGGTYSVTINSFTGLTINGTLSANTISATTYQNLPQDIFVTGATYADNTFTFTNNSGGTFGVLFNTVTGLTANTISATTYQNLPIDPDTYVTGFTFDQDTYILTLEQNTDSQFSAFTANLAILASDVTITGGTYNSNTGIATFSNSNGASFDVSGFTTGLTDTVISSYTYNNNTFTIKESTGGIFNVTFNTVTGLTVNGNLDVTGSTISQTISATTYQNLPNTLYTGDGTILSNRLVDLSSHTLSFSSSTSQNNLMLSGGNVGIGTITPSYKLDVSGTGIVSRFGSNNGYWYMNSNFASGNRLEFVSYGDLNIGGQWNTIIENNTYDTRLLGGYYQNYISLGSVSPNPQQATLFLQTGNFGIGVGTTDSGYKFTSIGSGLSGSANIDNILYVNNSNVGVGISSPSNKLHVSATTDPVRFVGFQNSGNTRYIVSDSNGVLSYRTDVLTGSSSISAITLSNNILSVIPNGGSATITTINAATGGTYSNGTITLSGSGTLSTITGFNSLSGSGISAFAYNGSTGILTITKNDASTLTAGTFTYFSALTQTNNLLTLTKNGGTTSTYTPNAATGGTYSNGTITLSGSGTLSNITGLIATAVTATTLSSLNVLSVTQNGGSATTTTINAATGGTFNIGTGTITLSGSGTLSTITGLGALTAVTLYSGDGTLAGNRIVNIGTNTLNFSSSTYANNLSLSSGNVGIGKIPSYKLDVNGDINFPTTTSSTFGIIRQNGTRLLHTYGTRNLFLGNTSGNFTTTGTDNIGIGDSSLQSNTSGYYNTAVGVGTLYAGSNGSYSTALGYNSLYNSYGSSNTGLGYSSLKFNTSGGLNVGVGSNSLYSNTTGNYNIGVGVDSVFGNTSGNNNIGIGFQSLYSNTTGEYNVAVGNNALRSTYTSYNNALGYRALYNNTSGYQNNAFGSWALYSNQSGVYNNAFGYNALYNNQNGNENVAIGQNALYQNTSGGINVAIGSGALYGNTTGLANIAVGVSSLASNQIGEYNTSIGYESQNSLIGSENTTLGADSYYNTYDSYQNVGIGNRTNDVYYGDVTGNTSLGYHSLNVKEYNIETRCYGFEFINTPFCEVPALLEFSTVYDGSLTDSHFEIGLPFSVNFLGTNYNSVNISTNPYITFGTGGDPDYGGPISYPTDIPSTVGLPGIYIATPTNNTSTLYKLLTGYTDGIFAIRYYGCTPKGSECVGPEGNFVYTLFFDEGEVCFQLYINDINGGYEFDYTSGVSDGISTDWQYYTPCEAGPETQPATFLSSDLGCPRFCYAPYPPTMGHYNVALGYESLIREDSYESIGSYNVGLGPWAGYDRLSGDSKLYIANNKIKTLIYGEFDNDLVGVNTESPTNALTVSAATDPVRFINVQPDSDEMVLTQDSTGVVHYRSVNSLAPFPKIVLQSIELGNRNLAVKGDVRDNLYNLFTSRLTDGVLFTGNTGTTLYENYEGVKIDYYTTFTSTGGTREKYLWFTQTYNDDFNPYTAFTEMVKYFQIEIEKGNDIGFVNFYCEIYLPIDSDCSAPTQVKLTNTLFNSLNPFKYSRNGNWEALSEFVRHNFREDNGLNTIQGDNFNRGDGWNNYYDRFTSEDIPKKIYDIVTNTNFYGSLSGESYFAITNDISWNSINCNLRENILYSVYVEPNTNFYSKFNIPTNIHGFYDVCLERLNNYYTTLLYDIDSGGYDEILYNSSLDVDQYCDAIPAGLESTLFEWVDTYRILPDGTPAVIFYTGETNTDQDTLLNDLQYGIGIDSSLKYIGEKRDKSHIQVLPGYQNIYILRLSVFGIPGEEGANIAINKLKKEYLVINDPSLNINNGYWDLNNSIINILSDQELFNGENRPYIIIQSNDELMYRLSENPIIFYGNEEINISVSAIYKGHTFRPLIYPLNLNQLTLEVPHSYLLTGITTTQVGEEKPQTTYNFGETYNNECNTFSYDTTINQRFRGGSIDSSFRIDGINGTVYALAIQDDGKIVVGGELFEYNGYTIGNIVRINTDGSIDLTFNPDGLDTGFNGIVYALAIQDDGKIVCGGEFIDYVDGTLPHGEPYNMSLITRLNTDGTFDTTFNSNGNGFKGYSVYALAIQSDGKIVCGGYFEYYSDGTEANPKMLSITRLNTNGTFDTTFNNNVPYNYDVLGFIYGQDIEYRPGIVFALAIQSDGKIVCGGLFSYYEDGTANNDMWNITRLNTDGSFDTSFNTYDPFLKNIGFFCERGERIRPNVRALDIQPDGKIIVGGVSLFCYIDTVDNYVDFANICRLNTDGTLDTTFDYLNGGFSGMFRPESGVLSVKVQSDGSILAGGFFDSYQDTSNVNYIAQLTSGGTLDPLSNIGDGLDDIVFAMAIQADYKVIVGGAFSVYQGTIPAPRLLRISGSYVGAAADGDADTTFAPGGVGFDSASSIYAIAEQSDGKLIVGGSFTEYSGESVGNIVRLNDDGSIDYTFNPTGAGLGFESTVRSIVLQPDGKILVGGDFTAFDDNFGTYNINKICRLNSDGTFDTTFLYSPYVTNGFDTAVKTIALQSDGTIYVGGRFSFFTDTITSYFVGGICKLNSDGTVDVTFVLGLGYGFCGGCTVNTIVVQPDGKILCGGDFVSYTGPGSGYDVTQRICRVKPNGDIDSSFNNGLGFGFDYEVTSIVLQPDNYILVGGNFTQYVDSISTYTTNRICRLDTTGLLDTSFINGVSTGLNDGVYSIVLQPDDKILVGGYFNSYVTPSTAYSVNMICRLDSNGNFDDTFNSTGTGFDGGDYGPVVYTMVLDALGKLTIGGNFTVYNGSPAPSIVRMYSQIILTYVINNKELRLIVKYNKLQKYDLITTPIKISAPRGSYDNKFVKLIPSDLNENFEQIIVNNLSHNKRKQLRPGSTEIYLAFYDLNTKKTSLIPNYKIITTRYGDNEVFKLIRGNVVINSVAP